MKSMVHAAFTADADALARIEQAYDQSFHGTHFREGYTAFIEKRAPRFR